MCLWEEPGGFKRSTSFCVKKAKGVIVTGARNGDCGNEFTTKALIECRPLWERRPASISGKAATPRRLAENPSNGLWSQWVRPGSFAQERGGSDGKTSWNKHFLFIKQKPAYGCVGLEKSHMQENGRFLC